MRATVITEPGGIDVIHVDDVTRPAVGTEDVLIEVAASAVNHTDVWIRRGLEGETPIIPGIDVAGTVTEVGDEVSDLSEGDRVVVYWNTTACGDCEFCHSGETTMCYDYGGIGVEVDGGQAEYVSVDSAYAMKLPDHVDFEPAAAFPSNFGTAWRALITRADLSPSDDVLVLGASGGVGHAAVQIAEYAGATVMACTSSEWKADRLRDLGADHVIDYSTRDFNEAVTKLSDGRGVDIVLDSVGGAVYEQAIQSLARGGKLVTFGATTGDADQAKLQHVFWNQLEVIGSTGCTMSEFRDIFELFCEGDVEPIVDRTLPLEDVPEAHRMLEGRDVFGKIVVTP